MRIAALVKQVPRTDQLRIEEGRLVREGVELEVNAYCRRANAKAVEIASGDGEVVVFSMGPPSAEDALREMIACGADRGVHLCDRAFAGADTLATARVLAAALRRDGPFDLVLCGLNSIDADTGQVGPEVAQLLGLPFACGVRELEVHGSRFSARLETDDGSRLVEGPLPAVLSTAERLCAPSKAPPEARVTVGGEKIRRVGAVDLGLSAPEVGERGSPTVVGRVRTHESGRVGAKVASVEAALDVLHDLGALSPGDDTAPLAGVPEPVDPGVVDPGADAELWCVLEPDEHRRERELLGEAAVLARDLGCRVTAVTPGEVRDDLSAQGADRVLVIPAGCEPEQWAEAIGDWAGRAPPWGILVEGTRAGRLVAAMVAARHGWGLTGDAVSLEIAAGRRLIAWKPAFGGRLVAAIESRSPVQMATVRPGSLSRRRPRAPRPIEIVRMPPPGPACVVTTTVDHADPDVHALLTARSVVGVGVGVEPQDYARLEPLRVALGAAPLAATRKVTDRGWLPRSRQIGLTGHFISPHLYVAVGTSGKLNHLIGVQNARTILAINDDPAAAIFEDVDIGLVSRWQDAVPALAQALGARSNVPA